MTAGTDIANSPTINNLKFWNPYQGGNYNQLTSPYSHTDKITALKVIDNVTLASGFSDKYVKLWNYLSPSFIAQFYTGSEVRALELLYNDELACALSNGVIQLWDLSTRVISKNLSSNTVVLVKFYHLHY